MNCWEPSFINLWLRKRHLNMKNYTAVLCLGLIILGQVSASKWDDVEDALNSLRDKIIDSLTGVLKADYKKLAQQVDSKVAAILSDASAIADKGSEYIVDYEIIKQAYRNSPYIESCVAQYEHQIKGLANADDIVQCVVSAINPTVDALQTANDNLVQLFLGNDVFSYEKNFLACGPSDETCLSGVLSTITSTGESVDTAINDVVQNDVSNIDQYLSKLDSCGSYDSIDSTAKDLVMGFLNCVDPQ